MKPTQSEALRQAVDEILQPTEVEWMEIDERRREIRDRRGEP